MNVSNSSLLSRRATNHHRPAPIVLSIVRHFHVIPIGSHYKNNYNHENINSNNMRNIYQSTFRVNRDHTCFGRAKLAHAARPCQRRYHNHSMSHRPSVASNSVHRKNSLDKPSLHSYALTGGVVEGVWVFHRHGDRTPSRSLLPNDQKEAEVEFWKKKLPKTEYIEFLNEMFPVDRHESLGEEYLDVARFPYGFLTEIGSKQMFKVGQRFNLRHCARSRVPGSVANIYNPLELFLDQWNISIYSTNYLRTVTSAQCFLHGLLGDIDHNSHDITVKVRCRGKDTLNAFDKNPEFMMKLVSDVVESVQFQTKDATAATLAARLALYLPGLANPGHRAHGGPSGINWIHATDHFVCRTAHNVQYTCLEPFESSMEAEMQEFALPALAHLSWRFRQWYQSPPLLSAIAHPPLHEVEKQLKSIALLKDNEPRPFTVFSCHDVTILSLLYGIGAELVLDESNTFWPAYATSLAFELVKVDNRNRQDSYIVRVLLNGSPIKVRTQGDRGVLTMQEFIRIVQNLAETNPETDDKEDSKDDHAAESSKRDDAISGWTG